jgi:GPH family glycoside/pentoside/hexuronide:cation symporter
MIRVAQAPPFPIPRFQSDLLRYGSVHFGKTLLWVGEDALALYLMVRVLVLPPALAGALFLASALLNAACDGLVGKALTRWRELMNRLPALLRWIVPVSGASFALLPFLPANNIAAAAALLLLFRTSFSIADVPHNVLTPALARQYGHLGIARMRAILSAVATLVIAGIAFLLLETDESDIRLAMALIGGVGLAAVLLMAPLPALLHRFRDDLLPDGAQEAARLGKVRPSLLRFSLASALGIAALAAYGKAILHVEFTVPSIGASALLLIAAGRLGSIWIWTPIARRIGNRPALGLAYLLSGLMAFLLPLLASSSFGPGTILLLMLAGLAGGGIALLNWACLSELVAARNEAGEPGLVTGFAWFTMSNKVALGLSGALVGAWLSEKGDPLHADPSGFWPLAIIVFLMSALTAAAIHRQSGCGGCPIDAA